MKPSTMRGWTLVSAALLLAGVVGTGPARAGEFDGPGGLSGPSDVRSDRWERGERRARGERGQRGEARMRGGKRGDMHGLRHGMRGRHGGKGRMGRGGGMHAPRGDFMAKLDLSERQKEQIQGIRQDQQRRMIQVRADIQKANLDLREMMRSDNPSQSRIDATIDRLAGLRADAHKARVATHLQVRSLLTDEQRKKLKDPSTGRGFERPRVQRRGDAGKS